MRPSQIAKTSESSHQQAFFAYCAFACIHGFYFADMWTKGEAIRMPIQTDNLAKQLPMLEWIHHIPNGGSRGDTAKGRAIRGGQLKAEGVRSGVFDVFLPYPIKFRFEYDNEGNYTPSGYVETEYCGLYIEFKAPKEKPKKATSKGGLSDSQMSFGAYAESVGYKCEVCYSWIEAVEALKRYLGYGEWS